MLPAEANRRGRRWIDSRLIREHGPALAVYVAVVVLFIVAYIKSPTFRTSQNLFNLLRQQVVLGIVSIGQTFTLLVGGLDLSTGSVVKLTTLLIAGALNGCGEYQIGLGDYVVEMCGAAVLPTALLAIGLGSAAGLVNGLLITRLRISPFIATFGLYSILRGLAFAYSTSPVGDGRSTKFVRMLYNQQWGPVPILVLLFAAFVYLAYLMERRTVFGRWVFAVGGNEQVARLNGIDVNRIKTWVFVISGACAGLAALVQISRMGVGDPITGEGLELDAITAVVLGGTSFAGGRGGIAGTIGGVLLLGLINNMLTMLAVSSFYQGLIKGLIILAAVGLYKQRSN